MEDRREAKRSIRSTMQKCLQQIDPRSRSTKSAAIAQRLYEDRAWRDAKTVLVYLALDQEPDTLPIILRALHERKVVALPRVDRMQGKAVMTFRSLELPAGAQGTDVSLYLRGRLETHPYGFLQPDPLAPQVDFALQETANRTPHSILCLAPGVAFTAAGERLGHGGGFYDKFLTDHQRVVRTIGICFAVQVVPELPVEGHDMKVERVLTEEGWFRSIG